MFEILTIVALLSLTLTFLLTLSLRRCTRQVRELERRLGLVLDPLNRDFQALWLKPAPGGRSIASG